MGATATGSWRCTRPSFPSATPGHRSICTATTAETFFVLDGTFEFTLGDERASLEPGYFALVPPGVPHTFANDGEAEARCLTITGPAGVEAFIARGGAVGRLSSSQPSAHGTTPSSRAESRERRELTSPAG